MKSKLNKNINNNSIANNNSLIEQLIVLHDMLGVEVTDVAAEASEFGLTFQTKAKGVLKIMSKLASDLSVSLLEVKTNSKKMTPEEEEDYNNIRNLTGVLGNLQFNLNKIIKKSDQFNDVASDLATEGMDFSDKIIEAQEEFRAVRSHLNAYGFLSDNPQLERLLAMK